ncbi:MAG: metabolite traffic protein EboE [Victivallales bacterium]
MKIGGKNHLCYSMNVFPEKDWLREDSVIREKVLGLRREVTGSDSANFAIGLWLDAGTACEFRKKGNLDRLKKWLSGNNLYVFTFNAFPYGIFHGRPVKKEVYLPDWTSRERLEYTCMIADILAELLPSGITGSVSTLPGGYRTGIESEEQIAKIAGNLLSAAKHLDEIRRKTGKRIILGIEPEPDCLWENPSEFISFYRKYLHGRRSENKHIGICYDTCHQELQFGKPGEGLRELIRNKIPIAKFQLSAALKAPTPPGKKALAKFADKVYLHQTRVIERNGSISRYADLPEAMEKADKGRPWLVHFHIPVFSGRLSGGLLTAKKELEDVLETVKSGSVPCGNLEIETYTFSVLPENMRKAGALKMIAKEYRWIKKLFC